MEIDAKAVEGRFDQRGEDECWPWLKEKHSSGYGMITVKQNRRRYRAYAHRLMWEYVHGEFDESLSVLHKCDNPVCVNPGHLFLGTQKDNMQDAARKGRIARGRYCNFAKITEVEAKAILEATGYQY